MLFTKKISQSFVNLVIIIFIYSSFFENGFYATPLDKYEDALDEYEDKEWDDSEKLFLEFIKENPYEYEVRDALFYLGEINRHKQKYLEAISYYNKLQERFKYNRYKISLLFLTGECYYNLNITKRASFFLEEYIKTEKTNDNKFYLINANLYLAELNENTRQWNNAVKFYQKALRLLELEKIKDITEEEHKKLKSKTYYKLGLLYANRFRQNKLAYSYILKSMQLGQVETPKLKFLMRDLTLVHLSDKDGLPDNAIADISVDGDDVWIATWGRGLVRFSRSREIFSNISLPSSQLRSIYVDFDNVYIATYEGIYIFDKRRSRVSALRNEESIFNLAQKVIKDDRYIYFTTLSEGVVKYDIIKKNFEILGKDSFIKTNMVYSIVADHQYIAFGTIENGVVLYDKKLKEYHYINSQKGLLKDNNIKSLIIDGRYLWVGVHNVGVYQYDIVNKNIKFFDWQIPFPTTIVKKDKEIWIGTSGNGIRIYNRENETLTKLRVIEGLSSNEVTMLRIEGNFVWIGYLDSGIDIVYKPNIEGF